MAVSVNELSLLWTILEDFGISTRNFTEDSQTDRM